VYNMGNSIATFQCDTSAPISRWSWNGIEWEQARPWGIDGANRNYEYIPTSSVASDGFSMTLVRGGCAWTYKFTYSPSIAHIGPQTVQRGHYSVASSTTYEGICYADPVYTDVQIHPEGEIALLIRDGSTGEIYLRLHWDQSLFVGRDELRGSFIYANVDDSGAVTLLGQAGNCGWSMAYSIATDVAPLPRIIDPANTDSESQADPPTDGFGVWNGEVVTPLSSACSSDNSLIEPANKYETVCVQPHGPAKLVITQCSDDRDDRFTTIMEVWWDGANQQWYGTDDTYWYVFALDSDDDGNIIDNRFVITATSDSGCTYTINMWRGDDSYTKGWKAAIITFALLLLLTLLIALYLLVGGGASGGGGGGGDYSNF